MIRFLLFIIIANSINAFSVTNINSLKYDVIPTRISSLSKLTAIATNYRPPSRFNSNSPNERDTQSSRLSGPSVDQRDAIVSNDPSIMVVAGPGAGKTRVLSARMAHLLEVGRCRGEEILVLSYTNTAAGSIKQRTNR